MCDVAQKLEDMGIAKGREEEKADTLKRVIQNYMKMEPDLTYEEAKAKAEAILK